MSAADKGAGVVLVTGASGFTGSTAVDYLLQYGYPVLATDLPGSGFTAVRRHKRFMREHPGKYRTTTLDIHPADLTNPAELKELFGNWNVKYLMHPAAVFDLSAPRSLLWKVNVEGTRNLLEAAMNSADGIAGVAVWSTALVYGGRDDDAGPASEDTEPAPANHYAESKLEEEKVVLEYEQDGLPAVILRPASVYGPRGRYGFAKGLGPMAKNPFFSIVPIPGRKDVHWSYVHVDDVVGAAMFLVYAIGHTPISGQVFNVADDTPMTSKQILHETAGRLRVPEPFMRMPEPAYRLLEKFTPYGYRMPFYKTEREEVPYLLKNGVFDNTRLKETGYQLKYPDTRIGLDVTLDWYARNMKLDRVWYLTHPGWRSYWKDIPAHRRPYADYALLTRGTSCS